MNAFNFVVTKAVRFVKVLVLAVIIAVSAPFVALYCATRCSNPEGWESVKAAFREFTKKVDALHTSRTPRAQ